MESFYNEYKLSQFNRIFRTTGLIFLALLIHVIDNEVVAQPCMPTVPTFTVNLSANIDTTWISPLVARQDFCCGSSNPDRCVQFIITLHPNTAGIIFNIASGALPTGSMYYQIGCSTPTAVGQMICLTGTGPYTLTFCKPGNNTNSYSITTVPKPYVSQDIKVYEGCNGKIAAYQATLGSILVLTLPLAWVFLKVGFAPTSVGVAFVITMFMCSLGRVFWGRYLLGMPVHIWLTRVLVPSVIVVAISMLGALSPGWWLSSSAVRLIVVIVVSFMSTALGGWFIAMTNNERSFIVRNTSNMMARIGVKQAKTA